MSAFRWIGAASTLPSIFMLQKYPAKRSSVYVAFYSLTEQARHSPCTVRREGNQEAMATEKQIRVPKMKLGSQGLQVSCLGLGCMGMSAFFGPPKPEPEMIEVIHHAINSGVTFLDTADIYGPHTNEILIGKACDLYGYNQFFSLLAFCNRVLHRFELGSNSIEAFIIKLVLCSL